MTTDQPNMHHLNGHQFENLVEQLIKKMGFIVEERKLTADGGIDILATSYEPILEGKYVIQCKKYTHKVAESMVRDLYGVVHSKNANKGILITNSTFTKKAMAFAQNKQLELIDGEKLRTLLVKYKIAEPEQEKVVLPNYALFLKNNFVPALRKIQKQVEDVTEERVYIEKIMYNTKRWIDFVTLKIGNLGRYGTFIGNIFNQSLTPALSKDDMQTVRADCEKIIDATKKLVDDYKTVVDVIPPQMFSTVHEKFLAIYPVYFEKIFRIADDVEKATTDPKPQTYEISFVLDFDKIMKELLDELEIAKARLNEQAKMKQPSTLEAIMAFIFIIFFIIMVFYLLMTILR